MGLEYRFAGWCKSLGLDVINVSKNARKAPAPTSAETRFPSLSLLSVKALL